MHTFSVALKSAATHTLTVTDTAATSMTAVQAGIAVAPARSFGFRGGRLAGCDYGRHIERHLRSPPAMPSANRRGYRGTVDLSSGDSQAALPTDYAFVAADNGVHSFTATLKTAATHSLTVTDTANSAVNSRQTGIVVSPAPPRPSPWQGSRRSTTAGVSSSFTVSAVMPSAMSPPIAARWNFTSSDSQAVLPGDYAFVAGDKGRTPSPPR